MTKQPILILNTINLIVNILIILTLLINIILIHSEFLSKFLFGSVVTLLFETISIYIILNKIDKTASKVDGNDV